MAKNISEAGIVNGQIVFADQILQLTDALRGDDAYNINLTGSISINDVTYPTTDGATSGSVLITDGAGVTGFGQVQSAVSSSYAVSASHAFSATTAETFTGNIATASYAISSSHAQIADLARTSLDFVVATYTASFSVSSFNYTFNHNLNFKYVLVQAYNTADEQILPEVIRAIDENNTFVRFSNKQNGTIVIQK